MNFQESDNVQSEEEKEEISRNLLQSSEES
jgi:hypothetical protein